MGVVQEPGKRSEICMQIRVLPLLRIPFNITLQSVDVLNEITAGVHLENLAVWALNVHCGLLLVLARPGTTIRLVAAQDHMTPLPRFRPGSSRSLQRIA